MPMITTPPDLTRTRATLASYDVIDAEITDAMTQDEADDFFKRSAAAKLAIGEAFALDTADRNEFEVARSWAAFNVDRTRAFVGWIEAGGAVEQTGHGVKATSA